MANLDDETRPDDQDVTEDDETTIDENEGGDEESIEDLRREVAEMRSALKKANGEARKFRLKAKANGKPKDEADDDEPAADAKDDQWRGMAVRAEARAALAEAGFTGNAGQSKKLARMLDLDDVEIGDDGDVDFGDQIDELKTDFPQLFGSDEDEGSDELAPRRRRAPKVATADKGRNTKRAANATDKQVAALLGRS